MQKIKIDKKMFLGAGAIMLAALFWSLDGVFIRPKFYEFPAPLIVFLEHVLGFALLSPFIFLGWSKIKVLRFRDWGAIFWICIFGGLIGTITITEAFFAAVHGEVTFATVVILQKLQPVFALLLARLILGEKLRPKFYFWAGLAITAAYFLTFGKTGLVLSEINWGANAAVLAVIAAFAFGSSTVFGKRVVNHLDFQSATALRFGITSLLALGVVTFSQDWGIINSLERIHWQYLLVIVFSSGAVAMFLYYFGLKRVTASVSTICELFWPFSAVILDYFINKNTLNSIQIVASLVLLLAFYQVVRQGKAKEKKFQARVLKGKNRGESLAAPTINLDKLDLDIAYGVYLVEVEISGKKYKGLLHFGPKETFSEGTSLELYLKEFIFDIPSADVEVVVKKKIRDIKRFANFEALKKQIQEDVKKM